MDIVITKKDVVWSYLAQFFNLATGLITLPLILKLLSSEEIGFNYILISINSIVLLLDLGFSGQISRYITYVFSGVQKIQKEGISQDTCSQINEHLLASILVTAKKIYLCISIIAFFCLITFGSWYVYRVTRGFIIIDNIIYIWSIFCISSIFNIYFLYINAFLQGSGLVKEAMQAQVYSKICQILIIFVLLYFDYGLLAVVVANLISPFVFRILSYKKIYTPHILEILHKEDVCKKEIKENFIILLYNAKKMGIIGFLSTAIGYASTLLVGEYMTLANVASYGLMIQIVGIITIVARVHFNSSLPEFANLIVKNNIELFKRKFGLSIFLFYCMCLLGFIGINFISFVIDYFEFDTQLPCFVIISLYFLYKVLEQNQSIYSNIFLIENDIRFYHSAVVTGIISFLALWVALYFNLGLLWVVLSQSIPLYIYAAWKWPLEGMRKYKISYYDIVNYPIFFLKKMIHEKLV